jgi:hypothetical protein
MEAERARLLAIIETLTSRNRTAWPSAKRPSCKA